MNQPIIRVENLSKRYDIGSNAAQSLREQLSNIPRLLTRRQKEPAEQREIWALKDINLEVQEGEVLGIIGHNGAGKSTLLKILSRITHPTTGRIEMHGRVSSLLEVGTGFHPELTGRENIFMNAAILGMKRAETRKKFDEIVDFAGVEKFIDTPVKRYSSGMYTRLAFSVAAHLEPEILIVDEVLSVGDAAFQKKSLGKMSHVSQEGRTVLFVSHNLMAVTALCKRAILVDSGRIVMDDVSSQVVHEHLSSNLRSMSTTENLTDVARTGNGKVQFVSMEFESAGEDGVVENFLRSGQDLDIQLRLHCNTPVTDIMVAIIIYDMQGYRLVDANTALQRGYFDMEAGEDLDMTITLKDVLLKSGTYQVGLWVGRENSEEMDVIQYARTLSVEFDTNTQMHQREFPGIYKPRFSYAFKKDTP